MWRSVDQLRRLPLADYRAVRDEHLRGTSPFLGSAKLKLVDACNLRCFMCDYWHGRRAGELDTDEVKRVLADLASLGCRKVHFTGGEIFMRRDAIALFEEATRLGMRVNLTTNGTLLDKGRARAMLVYALASSGDYGGAKAEHDRLAALSRPHPLTAMLLAFMARIETERPAASAPPVAAGGAKSTGAAPATTPPQTTGTGAGAGTGTKPPGGRIADDYVAPNAGSVDVSDMNNHPPHQPAPTATEAPAPAPSPGPASGSVTAPAVDTSDLPGFGK